MGLWRQRQGMGRAAWSLVQGAQRPGLGALGMNCLQPGAEGAGSTRHKSFPAFPGDMMWPQVREGSGHSTAGRMSFLRAGEGHRGRP